MCRARRKCVTHPLSDMCVRLKFGIMYVYKANLKSFVRIEISSYFCDRMRPGSHGEQVLGSILYVRRIESE